MDITDRQIIQIVGKSAFRKGQAYQREGHVLSLSCDGDTVEYCEDGELQTASCDDLCGAMGYTSSGCDPGNGCACDGLVDQECGMGASAMCTCFEWAGEPPCSDEVFSYMYDSCWNGSDETPRCVEDYVVDGTVDCEAAFACID